MYFCLVSIHTSPTCLLQTMVSQGQAFQCMGQFSAVSFGHFRPGPQLYYLHVCIRVYVCACVCLCACMCVFCPCPSAFASPDYDSYDMSTDDIRLKENILPSAAAALRRGCSSWLPTPPQYNIQYFLLSFYPKSLYLPRNVFHGFLLILASRIHYLYFGLGLLLGGDRGVKFV